MLSMHAEEGYVSEALRNGATGYALQGRHRRGAGPGRSPLPRPAAVGAGHRGLPTQAEGATLDVHDTLTAREREVLHLAVEGNTSAQVSGRLFISPRTVEIHRANLMRKLGLRSQTDLIRYAIRRGIFRLEG